ncbi:hypothetical protein [Bifidobacterium biavatii]|uniref:Uncharacterized protein n=1 Tax=Bifidobacterium biavatii DSM 23969 TaxID=1437608 RepID=A0A086ZLV2_9BIFI|nr:hypothetical protein [Bifidobacterium biavatii]KFI47502.1 hypothetical protein BBIA_1130 [Bifidobacterium biavatii DSM 23969]
MGFAIDDDTVARVAALPGVRAAAESGAQLIALWPLTDAKQMDNDAKYAENLQVRLTRTIARVTTGDDVTVPDAEFVYEGADEIPGRPQEIVDALLAANDAYDTMVGYRDDRDPNVLFDAADAMGVAWPDATVDALRTALPEVERAVAEDEGADGIAGAAGDAGVVNAAGVNAAGSAREAETASAVAVGPAGESDGTPAASPELVSGLAHRFAQALVICDGLFTAIDDTLAAEPGSREAAVAKLPVILFVNELREQMSVPRLCLSDGQYQALLDARAAAADTLEATAGAIAPVAVNEWKRHYDDVTWDPDEAKRRAKEEDERKNKEALAAKFAHVKDDPSKPEVEL